MSDTASPASRSDEPAPPTSTTTNPSSPSHISHQHIPFWRPASVYQCIGASRNFIGLITHNSRPTVLKYPYSAHDSDAFEALREEAARYEQIGPHDNIVVCHGMHEHGLMLEHCEKGDLWHLIDQGVQFTDAQKLSLTKDVLKGLAHLHRKNFIHCDVNVNNVFVTKDGTAKIGDMQGELKGEDGGVQMPAMSEENAKSRHPGAGDDEFSIRTDLFALGTFMFHLWHGHAPFPELDEHSDIPEIQRRYAEGFFPLDIGTASGIDCILGKCWTSRYSCAEEVLKDLHGLHKSRSEHATRNDVVILWQTAGVVFSVGVLCCMVLAWRHRRLPT